MQCPANKSLRGSRGPKAGVRGIPSPFINLDKRGRDTPHPSLLPLVPKRKDFLDEVLVRRSLRGHHSSASKSGTPSSSHISRSTAVANWPRPSEKLKVRVPASCSAD